MRQAAVRPPGSTAGPSVSAQDVAPAAAEQRVTPYGVFQVHMHVRLHAPPVERMLPPCSAAGGGELLQHNSSHDASPVGLAVPHGHTQSHLCQRV